jgi:hypothetical protein
MTIPRHSKIYLNWDFWSENIPSGNPAGHPYPAAMTEISLCRNNKYKFRYLLHFKLETRGERRYFWLADVTPLPLESPEKVKMNFFGIFCDTT